MPATNSSLTNLQYNQSFANDAAALTASFNLTNATATGGTAQKNSLTVSYDAATKGYTVTVGGRSQTFGSADVQDSDQYGTIYRKTDGTNRDYLTLLKYPAVSGSGTTQYVGMGFWQRNVVSGSTQDTTYATFDYGIPTLASAVPKTGTAGFSVGVFGLVTAPGEEPRSFSGLGDFNVDFGAGIFSTHSYVTETGLVSGSGTSGGGIDLTSAGRLSSDGSFSGTALYGGWYGSAGGVLDGRFYGPNGQEVGASFSAVNSRGMAVAGSLIGQRDPGATPVNLTLGNLVVPQLFYTQYGGNLVGSLDWKGPDNFAFGPPTSDLNGGSFTAADKVTGGDANFTTYRKTFTNTYNGTQDVTLDLYKPGSGNSQLALTYASFGRWSIPAGRYGGIYPTNLYFAYGLETPTRLTTVKTGTGHYEGVLYGTGINSNVATAYAVTGTSRFDVNFTAQSYSGALAMGGTPTGGGGRVDFGSFDFAGSLSAYAPTTDVTLTRGGTYQGQMSTRFYGPDGEEIAGTFAVNVPVGDSGGGTFIQGATVAKRQ